MHSARTTGFGGFNLSIEGEYTKIDDGADYCSGAPAVPMDPSTKKASVINSSPSARAAALLR